MLPALPHVVKGAQQVVLRAVLGEEHLQELLELDDGVVVRVSGLASELPTVLRTARDVGASVIGRAGLGLSWMSLGQVDVPDLVSHIEEVRRRLHPFPCVVLDAPAQVREKVNVWGEAPRCR